MSRFHLILFISLSAFAPASEKAFGQELNTPNKINQVQSEKSLTDNSAPDAGDPKPQLPPPTKEELAELVRGFQNYEIQQQRAWPPYNTYKNNKTLSNQLNKCSLLSYHVIYQKYKDIIERIDTSHVFGFEWDNSKQKPWKPLSDPALIAAAIIHGEDININYKITYSPCDILPCRDFLKKLGLYNDAKRIIK